MRMSMTPRASVNRSPPDGSRRDIVVGIARGALAGAAVAIGSDVAAQASPAPLPRVTEAVTPFRVVTSSAAISDARRRLQATRWPERETADDWRQGVPLATMQALVAYWRTAYDWRRLERRLNAYPQFRTEIDGLGIHFLHVRSPHEHARPIILTHGWPGSVVEFLNVIGPLTNPTKHGGQPEEAFHVVLPSLPGFGFSDKPTERGWGLPRIARAWSVLMRRLGYTNYLAQGGDWGAGVTTWMAKQHVEGLAAIHLNLPILFPPPLEGEPNQAEKATIAQLVAFNEKGTGYSKIQSTRPQTIGYALADSRLTDTAASSARLYYESYATDFSTQRLDLPVAVSIFPGEVYQPPRLWGERVYSRLFYWNEAARGGHFAAFEQPVVFVAELRAAFRALPRGG
jgi:pimeloyl-ACP methyl ester carboxylesterase